MIGVLQAIQPFIRYANQLVSLLAIVREDRDAMVHVDADAQGKRMQLFRKYSSDTAAECQRLVGVRLRQEQREFISSYAKSGVRSTQRFLECGGGGAQNFIAARMAMLIVNFFEAMQIENDEAELRAVSTGAVQLFLKGLAEQAAIVEASQRIGDCIELQGLQLVIFQDDRHAEEARGRKHVHERGLQRDWPPEIVAELSPARQYFVPQLNALRFLQIKMSDGADIPLKKLAACRELQTI